MQMQIDPSNTLPTVLRANANANRPLKPLGPSQHYLIEIVAQDGEFETGLLKSSFIYALSSRIKNFN